MRRPIDVYAVMQNAPRIMGLELQAKACSRDTSSVGYKWVGKYYLTGAPHGWKKDKLAVWAHGGGVIVGEWGGERMSLQRWLVEHGGCVDYGHAYDVMRGARASLEMDRVLAPADRAVGKYVDGQAWVRCADCGLDGSNLFSYFCRLFGRDAAERAFDAYMVTADERGNTVYWYVDVDGNICHDKVMRYKFDGHRDKAAGGWRKFTTADGYTNRCYFGAHLLADGGEKRVCVVEGEKTAMLCSLVWPGAVFLATGGKSQLRDVGEDWVLLPDLDAAEDWGERGRASRWWLSFDGLGEHSDLGDVIERYAQRRELEWLIGHRDEILENF